MRYPLFRGTVCQEYRQKRSFDFERKRATNPTTLRTRIASILLMTSCLRWFRGKTWAIFSVGVVHRKPFGDSSSTSNQFLALFWRAGVLVCKCKITILVNLCAGSNNLGPESYESDPFVN
jgi:hypothetical protein